MPELTRQGFKLTSGILAQFLALGKKAGDHEIQNRQVAHMQLGIHQRKKVEEVLLVGAGVLLVMVQHDEDCGKILQKNTALRNIFWQLLAHSCLIYSLATYCGAALAHM